ncbi:hypothetical protein X474_21690 [Dethiosulfatarculus sandiegensis]|uniref:Uncharacterized protein n=1 Tax=Dethiosulfatarculus sandiegensis TaxID=1429043 RepID=A0A0D2J8C5_9BACT|nr:hypothetical protein X474_21690 [Dethiosulfatarculus sandiegensis]
MQGAYERWGNLANLLGLEGEEITSTKMAYEHGLGEINLRRLKIREV